MPMFIVFISTFTILTVIILKYYHDKGWKKLQGRYRCRTNYFFGKDIKIRKVTIDGVGNRNTIRFKTSEEGLYMKPLFPNYIVSKPVLIPWTEIKNIQDKRILLKKYKKLVIGNPLIATIELSEADFHKFSEYIKIPY
jgi:hypothetical protein